uniref:Uncharacterized protein n=1 Tax=viral metagenome TaxID=1070528 RepID=A0A6C0J5L1_9ZZZZ
MSEPIVSLRYRPHKDAIIADYRNIKHIFKAHASGLVKFALRKDVRALEYIDDQRTKYVLYCNEERSIISAP